MRCSQNVVLSMGLADSVAWWMDMRDPEKSNMENGTPIRMCYKVRGMWETERGILENLEIAIPPPLSELVLILQLLIYKCVSHATVLCGLHSIIVTGNTRVN